MCRQVKAIGRLHGRAGGRAGAMRGCVGERLEALRRVTAHFESRGRHGAFADDVADEQEGVVIVQAYIAGMQLFATLPLPADVDTRKSWVGVLIDSTRCMADSGTMPIDELAARFTPVLYSIEATYADTHLLRLAAQFCMGTLLCGAHKFADAIGYMRSVCDALFSVSAWSMDQSEYAYAAMAGLSRALMGLLHDTGDLSVCDQGLRTCDQASKWIDRLRPTERSPSTHSTLPPRPITSRARARTHRYTRRHCSAHANPTIHAQPTIRADPALCLALSPRILPILPPGLIVVTCVCMGSATEVSSAKFTYRSVPRVGFAYATGSRSGRTLPPKKEASSNA